MIEEGYKWLETMPVDQFVDAGGSARKDLYCGRLEGGAATWNVLWRETMLLREIGDHLSTSVVYANPLPDWRLDIKY